MGPAEMDLERQKEGRPKSVRDRKRQRLNFIQPPQILQCVVLFANVTVGSFTPKHTQGVQNAAVTHWLLTGT